MAKFTEGFADKLEVPAGAVPSGEKAHALANVVINAAECCPR